MQYSGVSTAKGVPFKDLFTTDILYIPTLLYRTVHVMVVVCHAHDTVNNSVELRGVSVPSPQTNHGGMWLTMNIYNQHSIGGTARRLLQPLCLIADSQALTNTHSVIIADDGSDPNCYFQFCAKNR